MLHQQSRRSHHDQDPHPPHPRQHPPQHHHHHHHQRSGVYGLEVKHSASHAKVPGSILSKYTNKPGNPYCPQFRK
jgi:hypothetical protein